MPAHCDFAANTSSQPQSRLTGKSRWGLLAVPLLTGLLACQDATAPLQAPEFAHSAKQPQKGIWTVTSLADSDGGSCATTCTLRQAIAAAAAGERIVFKSNLSGTIVLENGQLEIQTSLNIDGGGRITVDAGGTSRVLEITGDIAVALTGLTLTGGVAPDYGGGIYSEADLTLRNVSVSGNSSPVQGGGIYSGFSLTIINSTISENVSEYGGGIYSYGASIVGSTISENEAEQGGGLYGHGIVAIRSTTVAANKATVRGGGLLFDVDEEGGSVANTIIGGNSAPQNRDCGAVSEPMVSHGHNLMTLGGGCDDAPAASDVVVFASQIFADVLAPLANNGGPTSTHALIERGLAIDAGRCPGQTTDQRGSPRPYDDLRVTNAADGCDIGAFEWQPTATGGSGKGPKNK
jgi:CSLREA domain-containing protein